MNTSVTATPGLLRSRRFDTFFVLGVPFIAILSGLLVAYKNELFLPVLVADLWLLGYHHVVSTYTRLAFDVPTFRENRSLILALVPVAIAVIFAALIIGPWVVASVYLYWQWWHYTRQSEGISKAYAAKSRDKEFGNPTVARATFYAVPVLGILAVSHRSPEEFLFLEVRTLPVNSIALSAAALITAALVILWASEQYKAYRNGRLAAPYVRYVLTHFAIYVVAYILIREINYGWLTINIWHNLQYILFVWLFNNRRFQGRANKEQRFLSLISQDGRFVYYFVTCFMISTAVYLSIDAFLAPAMTALVTVSATTTALIIYQTINFHHYIVDSLIWKLRKPKLQKTLRLDA